MLKCDRVNEDITILLYYIMLNVYWYTKSITPNSACNMQPAHSCIWSVCLIYMFTHPQVYTILTTQCIHYHSMTYNTHSSEPVGRLLCICLFIYIVYIKSILIIYIIVLRCIYIETNTYYTIYYNIIHRIAIGSRGSAFEVYLSLNNFFVHG